MVTILPASLKLYVLSTVGPNQVSKQLHAVLSALWDNARQRWNKLGEVYFSFPILGMQLVFTKFASDIVARHKTLWSYWESLPSRRIQRCRDCWYQAGDFRRSRKRHSREAVFTLDAGFVHHWLSMSVRDVHKQIKSHCVENPTGFGYLLQFGLFSHWRCSLTWKNSLFYFPKYSLVNSFSFCMW